MRYLEHCFFRKMIRYGSVVVFGFIMILLSQLTGLHEFMFPEGISVVLGVWAIEKQPWRVNKVQLFFMMIIGSICAVCIVKYLPIPLIFQVLIGFILVGISLLVTKTSFAPVVSAFMLPILLQSDSWLFPLLVIGYIGIIIAIQTLYQKTGLTQKTVSSHTSFQWKNELFHWCILLIIFSVLSIYPTVTHSIYFMVPPLIITFVEMAEVTSPARKRPLKVYAIMALAPWIGTAWRFLSVYTPIPTYITFPCALVCLCILMELIQFPFAAAGSLVTLPFLFSAETLIWYPVQSMIGLIFFMVLPILIFRNKTNPPKYKIYSLHKKHAVSPKADTTTSIQ